MRKEDMAGMNSIAIAHVEWGKIEVDLGGRKLAFKDCKIWPGGAKEWDWGLTGTRHNPGTQPRDIEELLRHNVDVMILSRGMELVLQTCPETIDALTSAKIETHVLETTEAVKLFNELTQQGQRVAGVFHSTC